MKKLLILGMVFSAFSFCRGSKSNVDSVQAANKGYRWGTAESGLRIRVKPAIEDSKIIGLIPHGEKIILIKEVGASTTISGANGKWSYVKWNKKKGYAFGGFLAKKPPKMIVRQKTRAKTVTITEMNQGDIACYITFKKANGRFDTEMADFKFCEDKSNYIGKKAAFSYRKQNVLSPECQGDHDCGKSQLVDLVAEIKILHK